MNYIYRIRSSKGIPLEYLYIELELIVSKYENKKDTKLTIVPASNCVLLTSNNLMLRHVLLKDEDFILTTAYEL